MKRPKKIGSTLPKRDVNVIFTRRAALLSLGGIGAMATIGVRMAQLQATDLFNQQYTNAADENRFDTHVIAPPRGVIYDRFGVVLAQTSKDYRVSIVQEDAENVEEVIGKVAAILGFDQDWVRRRVLEVRGYRRFDTATLRQGLTWDEFNAINVRLPELKGIVADSADVRAYPYDIVFAHPLGYVQKPTQRDVDAALAQGAGSESRAAYLRNPDVRLGKSGLELELEPVLHGDAGWRKVIVNAFGREMGEDERERHEPTRGSGVVTTIDAELQRIAMQSFGGESGAAVVMDIYTGDILAMVSAPGFDPNLFVNGISTVDFAALNADEKKPLFNKAVSGAFAPGSTFKTMVGIALRQTPGVDDNFHANCPGYFSYGGRDFHCWKKGGHGSVDLHRAIRESCDVFFYNAALRAGPERIAAVAREFGLGHAFDVSVPHVEDGVVPDPAWMQRVRHQPWTGGLTLNYSIGQGDMLATPLQLAVQVSRLANNGRAVIPRLVREAPGVGEPPQPAAMTGIAPEHLAAIRMGMFGVCNEPGGTGARAGALINLKRRPDGVIVEAAEAPPGSTPVQIAGKTGTAQVRIITMAERARGVINNADLPWRMRDHALLICFGPWDAPRYACAVVHEHGGHVNSAIDPPVIAAAIMRETMKRDPANRPPARLATLEPRARGQA